MSPLWKKVMSELFQFGMVALPHAMIVVVPHWNKGRFFRNRSDWLLISGIITSLLQVVVVPLTTDNTALIQSARSLATMLMMIFLAAARLPDTRTPRSSSSTATSASSAPEAAAPEKA